MATQAEAVAALPDRLQDLPNIYMSDEPLGWYEKQQLWSAVQELQRNQMLIIQALKTPVAP